MAKKIAPHRIKHLDGTGEPANLSGLPQQNEILFVLDSVGWTEFSAAKAPNIKSLRRVHPAWSHSYYTPPSVEAMFRGALPQPDDRCFWPYGRYSTAGENVVIPITMRNRGYHTYLMSSNLLISTDEVKAGHNVVSCHKGMFEHCFMNDYKIMSSEILVDWFLERLEEPFFVFFLVIETHTPYLGKDKRQSTQIQAIEVVDKAFGKLVKGIRAKKLGHNTRAIVTSDHSEAWTPNNRGNDGHNPRHLRKYIANNRMKRLTRVFMARGQI